MLETVAHGKALSFRPPPRPARWRLGVAKRLAALWLVFAAEPVFAQTTLPIGYSQTAASLAQRLDERAIAEDPSQFATLVRLLTASGNALIAQPTSGDRSAGLVVAYESVWQKLQWQWLSQAVQQRTETAPLPPLDATATSESFRSAVNAMVVGGFLEHMADSESQGDIESGSLTAATKTFVQDAQPLDAWFFLIDAAIATRANQTAAGLLRMVADSRSVESSRTIDAWIDQRRTWLESLKSFGGPFGNSPADDDSDAWSLQHYERQVIDYEWESDDRFEGEVSARPFPPPPRWIARDGGWLCVVRSPRQLYAVDDAGQFWPSPQRHPLLSWPTTPTVFSIDRTDAAALGNVAVDDQQILLVIDDPQGSSAIRRPLGDTTLIGFDLLRDAALVSGTPVGCCNSPSVYGGPQAERFRGRFVGTPLIAGDMRYVAVQAAGNGLTFRIAAFDSEMSLRWLSDPIGVNDYRLERPDASVALAIDEHRLYFVGGLGTAGMFDARSGTLLTSYVYPTIDGSDPFAWQSQRPASRLLIAGDVTLWNAADAQTFWATDRFTGRLLWSVDSAIYARSPQLVAADDDQNVTLALGDRIQAFDLGTGRVRAAHALPTDALPRIETATLWRKHLLWASDDIICDLDLSQFDVAASAPPTSVALREAIASSQIARRSLTVFPPFSFSINDQALAIVSANRWQIFAKPTPPNGY